MVLVTAQRRLLTDNVEELIRQHADDLATIVTSGQVPAILTHTEGTLEQIVTPDGKVLAASPDLGAAPHSAHRHRETGPRSCTPSSLCPPNLPSSGS